MPFVQLTAYAPDELRADVGLDGPCLMHDGAFGLFVSLRGKDGGAMPSPSELRWRREVPDRMRSEPVHVFLRRREEGALYLGSASFIRTGSPGRDGFRSSFRLAPPLPESRWRELVAAAGAPPPAAPEEAIAALTRASTAADRLAAMQVFAERWYGPVADDASMAPSEARARLPGPLRRLYELAARRPVVRQNTLVEPDDLVVVEDKLTFYVENQGVCEWAIEPSGEDPPVFVRGNAWGDPWVQEAPALSGFVVQVLIYEAVLGGAPFSARSDGVSASELRKLERKVAPLELPPWSRSKTRFLGANGIVGFCSPCADRFRVELAAREREPFEAIEKVIADWPELGF